MSAMFSGKLMGDLSIGRWISSQNSSVLADISAVSFLWSLLLKDIIAYYISPSMAVTSIGVSAVGCMVTLLSGKPAVLRAPMSMVGFVFAFITIALLCLLYGLLEVDRINFSPFFSGFLVALLITSVGSNKVPHAIYAILPVNFLLQSYEQYSGTLIYPTISVIDDLVIDAEGYSIGFDAIRTKGFFQGPLHIVSISLIALLLYPRSLILHVCFVGCSFLAGARLGLVISLLYFTYYLLNSGSSMFTKLILVGTSALATIVAILLLQGSIDEDRLRFLGMALDFRDNESNLTRVWVWNFSLEFFGKYDFMSMLFGRYDDIRLMTSHRSTESDWLRLLVDNGLVTFAAYSYIAVRIFIASCKMSDVVKPFHVASLLVAMNLFPCIGWIFATTCFWYAIFCLVHMSKMTRGMDKANKSVRNSGRNFQV